MNINVTGKDLRQAVVAKIENDFDFLSPEYRELFGASAASAFQRPLWLHAIYGVLAGRLGARPHIIVVRRASTGELAMVIPLAMQKCLGVNVLQPADFGVCDYNAIVAEPEVLAALAANEDFVRQIRKLLTPCDVVIFRKLRGSVAAVSAILGTTTTEPNENSAFEVGLGGGAFDEWQRANLKKRFRNGASRRMRKLQADHRCVETVNFREPAEIEAAIRFIAQRRSARFEDDILHNEAYVDFYLHFAQAGASSGEAVTSGLVVDGELVSADFGIVDGSVYHSVLCAARLDDYGQYAPGLLGLMELIRKRHQCGDSRFDFGIGKSRQKLDFAGTERPLCNVTAAMSLRGRLTSLIYNRAKPLKTLLRKRLARIR